MKNTIIVPLLSFSLLMFAIPSTVMAQEDDNVEVDNSLKGQFREMLDKSEDYTEYKVIKKTRLNTYAKAVQDSIRDYRKEINALKISVAEQKSQISSLNARITELEAQLTESEELRESLSFLGLNLTKATYHVVVWVIIAALVAFGVFAYSSFIRSNAITAKSKKEYKALELEYEEHKKKSHEKQIKMGRELQTERNRVEELKSKIKAKTPGKI
jgi:DNA repair exonuclease SbcCD ATPase subunit